MSYEYDSLNQLKKETYSLPLEGKVSPQATDEVSYDTITYQYDTRGNILSKTYLLGETVVADNQYTYADTTWKDRLTEYNDVEIGYDQIGNPKNWIDGSALAWQKGRQLASYTKDGVETAFTYDVDGIRRSKTTNGVKTEYNVYDGQLRSLTSGDNTMRFVYGNGLSSVIFNDTEYWYVYNAQGDVLGLIDASGNYVVQYTYDAWGKILSQTESDLAQLNPFRYRGYIYDEETGLYYVSSRYYDPEVGRWLNADGQISSVGGDIRGYNAFAYCFNNPVNMDDPSGNWPKWLTGTLTVAAGAAQIAAGAALGAAVGWTGIGAVAAGVLLVAGSATVVQGVGQIVNDVTNSDVMFEGNALKYSAQEITRHYVGDDAAEAVGIAYDLTVTAASTYATVYPIANYKPTVPTGNHCFIAGTAISTSTGYKAIEEIRAGDMVWAENPETGEKGLKEVVQTFVNETSELIHVHVNGEEIVTTPEHPFYIPQKGWTPSIELHAGDILVLQNGKYVVIEQVQHEILESPIKVYNFEVADFHTYYVGKSAVLVHNTCNSVSVGDLIPTHELTKSKRAMMRLTENISINGIQESVKYVIYKGSKYIVDGHHRVAAAKMLGMSNIPAEEVNLPYAGYKSFIDLFG